MKSWTYGWDGVEGVFFIPEISPCPQSPHGLSVREEAHAKMIAAAPVLEGDLARAHLDLAEVDRILGEIWILNESGPVNGYIREQLQRAARLRMAEGGLFEK